MAVADLISLTDLYHQSLHRRRYYLVKFIFNCLLGFAISPHIDHDSTFICEARRCAIPHIQLHSKRLHIIL